MPYDEDSSIQSAQQRGSRRESFFVLIYFFKIFYFSFDALVKVESRNQLFPCRGIPIVFVLNFLSTSFESNWHLRQPPSPTYAPDFFFFKAFFVSVLASKQSSSRVS